MLCITLYLGKNNYNFYYYYTAELRRDDQELHRGSSRHFENRTRFGVFGRTVTMTKRDSITAKCILFSRIIEIFRFCYNLYSFLILILSR